MPASGLIAQLSNDNLRVPGSSGGGVDILLTTPDTISIEPGKIITANFQITNTSRTNENFAEKISLPPGWRLIIPRPKSFTLGPSEQSVKMLTFLVPGKANADTYRIIYTAESLRDPDVSASQEISVIVSPLVKVEIMPLEVPEAVIASEEYTATLRVTNRGNAKTDIELSVRSRPNYDVTVNPRKMVLEPGESQNITIDVKTEDDSNRQITNILTVEAEIEDAEKEKSTVVNTVKVKVLPKLTTEFDPYHRLETDMKITYASERGASGRQIEYTGKGNLDEDGKNKVNFQFRGPDIQEINPYGRRDEYKIEYSYDNLLNLKLGDRGYSLSPLTKMYTYGRGAEVDLEPGNVKFMSHYVENRWNPDEKQISSSLSYDVGDSFVIKGNVFGQQLNAQQYNNRIYSLQGSLRKYQLLNADVEYAYNMNDTQNSSGASYQVLLNGRYGNRLSYNINKTHADPKYLGYYRDIDYLTGRVNLRLYKQIQARVNFRDYASNLDLDDSKSSANRENFIKTGLTIPIFTRGYVSMDYEHFEKKDVLESAKYDFTENTVILNTGLILKSINVRTGVERGLYNNNLPGNGQLDRERYRANIIFRPTPTQYYSFSSNIGNYKYSASNERSKSAGIKGNWKITENLTVDLNYWKYNFGMGKNKVRDNVYSTIDYLSKRNHTISLRAYVSNYRARRDRSVFLSYSIPISVPTSKIKSVGVLTGTIKDMEKEGNPPVPEVIVLLNGISAITNRRGEYFFSSLKPGKYFLRIDEKSIGLTRIPTVKTPLEISITGGQKVNHEIGVITSGRIFGKVTLYAYGNKSGPESDSADIPLNTIRGLADGELGAAGGMENVLLELSRGSEMIRMLSDSNGLFSFDNLRPGTWSMKIYDDAVPMHHIIENSTRKIVLEAGGSHDIPVKVMPKQRQIKFLDQGSVSAVTVKAGSIPAASGTVRPRPNAVPPKTDSVQPVRPKTDSVRPVTVASRPALETVRPAVDPVEIPVPAGSRPFTVQILSSKILRNALDYVELYQSRGYPAFYNLAEVSGMGNWYRVYAGVYPTREEAAGAAQSLINQGYLTDPWVKIVDFELGDSQIPGDAGQTAVKAVPPPLRSTESSAEKTVPVPVRAVAGSAERSTAMSAPIPAGPSGNKALPFTVQVSSHRDKELALNEVMDFRAQGYNAYMEGASITGIGDWYRVFAGQYLNRQEAAVAAQAISEKGLASDPWVKMIQSSPNSESIPEPVPEPIERYVPTAEEPVTTPEPVVVAEPAAATELITAEPVATESVAAEPVPTERPAAGLFYTIQVASYQIAGNARNEVMLYKSRGYDSFQLLSSVPGIGDWYRVYVGRFSTEEEARNVSVRLMRSGFIKNPWVQRVEIPSDTAGGGN